MGEVAEGQTARRKGGKEPGKCHTWKPVSSTSKRVSELKEEQSHLSPEREGMAGSQRFGLFLD